MQTTMQTYAGHELATLEYGGEPVWLASQVGEALGYADSKSIARAVRRNWSEDFEPGVEFHLLRGAELSAVKAAAGPVAIPATASSVMVLTQAGVDAVLQLTQQPEGTAFRRWWRRSVLPALRDAGVTAGAGVEDVRRAFDEARRSGEAGELVLFREPDRVVEIRHLEAQAALAKEQRLREREDRLRSQARKRTADDMRATVDRLYASGAIRGDVLAHYLVRALELQTGETFHQLRPAQHEAHTYATPTVIARRAGTTSAAVGRVISGIEVDGRPLRGHPDEAYCRTLIKGRLHTDGDCVAYEYTPLAERLIRRELQRRAGA